MKDFTTYLWTLLDEAIDFSHEEIGSVIEEVCFDDERCGPYQVLRADKNVQWDRCDLQRKASNDVHHALDFK